MGPNHTDERLDSSTLKEMDGLNIYHHHPLHPQKTNTPLQIQQRKESEIEELLVSIPH
jgi:hypothetical protein